MKKCTSCSKDLPDAALHCVFCGAKQPAAAAPQAGLAKTVMGYSAQEMIQQIRQQGAPGGVGAPPNAPPSTFAPAQPAAAHSGSSRPQPSPAHVPQTSPMAATIAPVGANAFNASALNPPPAMPSPASQHPQLAATIAPQQMNPQLAATIAPQQMSPFAPPSANPGAALGTGPMTGGPTGGALIHGPGSNRGSGPSVGGPAVIGGGGVLTGSQPIVMEPPPVRATPTPPAATRPIIARPSEAADALGGPVKGMMLVAGILLIVSFVMPSTTDPMAFPFEALKNLSDMPVDAMVQTLLVPAVGVLSLIFALAPLAATKKSAVALLFGLGGIAVLVWGSGSFEKIRWQDLTLVASQVFLSGGLVARGSFTSSLVARVLATLGVALVLAAILVPDHGSIPLVDIFTKLFDGKSYQLKGSVISLVSVLASVLGLLCWIPAPSTAGAHAIAWFALVFTLGGVSLAVNLGLASENFAEAFKSPGDLLAWVPSTAFLGLAGWGLAGVVGRPSQ